MRTFPLAVRHPAPGGTHLGCRLPAPLPTAAQIAYTTVAGRFVKGAEPLAGDATVLARIAGAGYKQVRLHAALATQSSYRCRRKIARASPARASRAGVR